MYAHHVWFSLQVHSVIYHTTHSKSWNSTRNSCVLKRFCAVSLLIVFLFGLQVECDEMSTIVGHLQVPDKDSTEVWIGIFENSKPENPQSSNWTMVSTKRFQVSVPQRFAEIMLVALRRDSVPIVRTIPSSHFDREVTLDFSPGRTVKGVVLSTDGFPIPHAILFASCDDQPSVRLPDEAEFKWKSDSQGRYTISGLSEGNCTIDVRAHPDMQLETFQFQIRSMNTTRDLILESALFVFGRVVDHAGEVVADATVTADTPGRGVNYKTTSTDGSFGFGPYSKGKHIFVSATHKTNGSTRTYEVIAGKSDLVLRLSALTRIVGHIVDSRTGDPINEFTLNARRKHSGARFPHEKASGRVSALVDSSTHSVALEAPGYAYHWEAVRLFSGVEYDLGTVELEPGKTLTGRVEDVSSKQAIPGATLRWLKKPGVKVSQSETHKIRYFLDAVSANTDENGEFEIGPLPFEDADLTVTAPGYDAVTTPVMGHVETLDIPMSTKRPRNTRIQGLVQTETGEPVRGMVVIAHVEGGGAGLGNEEDGTFDRGVNPGSFEVYADTEFGRSNVEQITLSDGEMEFVTLVVDTQGTLTGTIQGLLEGEVAMLKLDSTSGLAVRYKQDLANGEFRVQGFPAGHYSLVATTSMRRELRQEFEISEEIGEARVELFFDDTSMLFGSVLGGELDRSAIRVLAKPIEEGATWGWSDVYADGTYEIHGLEDGEYVVGAHPSDRQNWRDYDQRLGEEHHVDVRGDTQLDIPLTSGVYELSGSIFPIDQSKGALVSLSSPTQDTFKHLRANEKGQFRFGGLPAGRYVLSINVEGFVNYRETLHVGPSIEGHQVNLEPIPLGPLFIKGTVLPGTEAAGGSIAVSRLSDRTRIKSVPIDENGKFSIEDLVPGMYLIDLYVEGFEYFEKEISLDAPSEAFDIMLVPERQ